MVMDITVMVSDPRRVSQKAPLEDFRLLPVIIGIFIVTTTHAADWQVTPRVSMSETYTDNVTAAPSDEQSDFITEISPGVNL